MLFTCEKCRKNYSQYNEALHCESKKAKKSFDIGDIVTTRQVFGWFDGNPGWTYKRENGRYGFYYLITGIEEIEHAKRYTLYTLAMSEKSGYRHGWDKEEWGHGMTKTAMPVYLPSLGEVLDLVPFVSSSHL